MSEYKFNEAQEAWLKALESGEYKQGKGWLHTLDGKMCCLGIACEIAALPKIESEVGEFYIYIEGQARDFGYAPDSVVDSLRLRSKAGSFPGLRLIAGKDVESIAHANDMGATFSEIAAFIRSNPTAVFKE